MSSEGPIVRKPAGALPRRVRFLLALQTFIIGFLVFWFWEEYENNQYLQAYLNNTIAENGQAYVLLASMAVAILGAVAYARLKIQNMKAEQALRAELARRARETFTLSKRRTTRRTRRETSKQSEALSTLSEGESSVIRLEEPEAGVVDQRRFEDVSPPIPRSGKMAWTESLAKPASETTMPVLELEAPLAEPKQPTQENVQVAPSRPLARVSPLPRHVVARPLPSLNQERGLAPLSGQASHPGLNRVGPATPGFKPARRTVNSSGAPVFREPGGPPPGLAGVPLTHRVVKQRVGEGPMDNPLPDNSLLPVRRVVSRQGLNRVAPLRPVVPEPLENGPAESSEVAEENDEGSNLPELRSREGGMAPKRADAKRPDLDESQGRSASQQSG